MSIVPSKPKIYHIVHVDRLQSIIEDDCLWCDAESVKRSSPGTHIGLTAIKHRRLYELTLASYPDLHVGECVPFYFCPRSVMLYMIHKANHPDLTYLGGQSKIIHLEVDLHDAVTWANHNQKRWAFTLTNAGSYYFEDRCDLSQLHEIDWNAIRTNQWGGANVPSSMKEGKQAEFLMEHSFSWDLVERIGVISNQIRQHVSETLPLGVHRPRIEVKTNWYY